MKKLLLLGAMLVLGATSFSLEVPVVTGSESATLNLKAQGTILANSGDPVLVVEPKEVGGDTGALLFNFNNLSVGGGAQTLNKDFIAQIEIDGVAQELTSGVTMTAKLSGGTAGTNATENISISLYENGGDTSASLGTLIYSSNFDKVTIGGKVMGYQGNVVATVTPTAAGSFINTEGNLIVTLSGYSVP